METGIAPILHEAMLTPAELPGWSPVANPLAAESPFSHTVHSDRFIEEASVRLEKDETGEVLVQHIGVLSPPELATLEQDLAVPAISADQPEMLDESPHEAWAVAPLQLPPLAEQAVSFRLIGGLEDSRFLLADNVYMRRGCVALALVRIDPDVRQASGRSIEPLATLADRKLAVAAEKIGAG